MRARGLVLVEVLTGAAVLAIAVALLLVAGDRQRRLAGLSQSTANLRLFGTAHASYGNDSAGRVATFSWRTTDTTLSSFPDLRGPFADNFAAAAAQAVDIMRRRSGASAGAMPAITPWVPHTQYSHLVLVDYLAQPSPAPWMASPGDLERLKWRQTGVGPGLDPAVYRWVHSSSYELPPAFWATDFGGPNGVPPTVVQSSSSNTYAIIGSLANEVGKRRYDAMTFPGGKVMVFETFQRFFGPRDAFFAYAEARVPALMGDGSVVVRRTGESNLSGDPRNPTSTTTHSSFSYSGSGGAAFGYPPALYGPTQDTVDGYFRWTRYGMRGRDFDGPEVTSIP